MEDNTSIVTEEKSTVSATGPKKEEPKNKKEEKTEPAATLDAEAIEEQKQTKIMKKQLRATRFNNASRIVILLIVVVMAAVLFPSLVRINNMVTKLDGIVDDVSVMTKELSAIKYVEIADKLQTTADGLAELDFEGMSNDLSETALTAQTGITEAMGKIDEMDIEGLNSAVAELQVAVKSLNDVTKMFRR